MGLFCDLFCASQVEMLVLESPGHHNDPDQSELIRHIMITIANGTSCSFILNSTLFLTLVLRSMAHDSSRTLLLMHSEVEYAAKSMQCARMKI